MLAWYLLFIHPNNSLSFNRHGYDQEVWHGQFYGANKMLILQ